MGFFAKSTARVHCAGWALLALASAPAAAAVQSDLTRLSLEQLLDIEVTTATRFAQRVSEAPSSMSVVTADDIRTYGYRTLGDILRSMRGLYIVNDRNYSYVGVRGFGRPGDYNTRVLILVDGHRINDNVYDQGFIGTEFPVDVDLIERVEFAPGPGSAVYGNSAFLGVINVITKNGSALGGLQASAEAASYGTAKGRVSHGRRLDNGAELLLSVSRYDSQGEDVRFREFASMNNGVAEGLDRDDYRQAFARFSHDGLSITAAYGKRTKGIPTASFEQVFNDPRSDTVDEHAFVNAAFVRNVSATLEASGALYYGQYEYGGRYVYDYPPVDVNYDGSRGRWWGGELRFLSTVLPGHKIMAGGELRHDGRQEQFNYDAYGADWRDSHTRLSHAFYLQHEYRASDALLLSLGLRYDHFRQSGETEQSFNPRLAAVIGLTPETTLKAMAGTAFRAPNNYEKYYAATGSTANPDLRPERIRTYELALDHYWSANLRSNASVYYYRIRDMISLADIGGGAFQYVNADDAKGKGVELETEKIWPGGTRLRGSYAWQLAEDGKSGARLSNSPRHLAKLNLATPLWADIWQLGIESQFISRRLTAAGGTVGGAGVTNLVLSSTRLAKGLEVSAGLYNLFDRHYLDPASEEHWDSSGLQLNGIPQSPRHWRLKLSYAF